MVTSEDENLADPNARVAYSNAVLDHPPPAPWAWLREWYAMAVASPAVLEAGSVVLSTVDEYSVPHSRAVLIKDVSPDGLSFYTNLDSPKGRDLRQNPAASLLFLWPSLFRQIRMVGITRQVSDQVADRYFAQRPRGSQLSAWASMQSQPIADRASMERKYAQTVEEWKNADQIPRPPRWGGFLFSPTSVEFWVGHSTRLHDRILYTGAQAGSLLNDDQAWVTTRLQP